MSSDLAEVALDALRAEQTTKRSSAPAASDNISSAVQHAAPPPSSLRRSSSQSSRLRKERAMAKEAEWADMESSLPTYDWKQPRFSVNGERPKLIYIHRPSELAQLEQALQQLTAASDNPGPPSHTPVLGFDMEWPASFHVKSRSISQRTAIIQICSRTLVLIIHISQLVPFDNLNPKGIPPPLPKLPLALEAFLRRSDALKAGVNILKDGSKLEKEFCQTEGGIINGVQPQGLLELSRLARQVDTEHWSDRKFSLISLRELVATYLERSLDKGPARTSDWSRALSKDQIEYAASDVMAGLEVYEALRRRTEAKMAGAALGSLSDYMPLKKKRKYSDIVATRSGETQLDDTGDAAGRRDEEAEELTEQISGAQARTLESQQSSSASPPPSLCFGDLVRLCTSSLVPKRPPSAAFGSGGPDTKQAAKKARTPKPPSLPKNLSHQRTFDLWAYGHGREDFAPDAFRDGTRPTLREVAKARGFQSATAANYVLRSLVEKRYLQHKADEANESGPSRSGELPTNLKARLEAELGHDEYRSVRLQHANWLTRHKVAVPIPSPTSG
ncbi:hypothetical protein OC845_002716 [Tilletia horrida]|nr:hypothetical protein OC845_002716 [Tilletia horrida]